MPLTGLRAAHRQQLLEQAAQGDSQAGSRLQKNDSMREGRQRLRDDAARGNKKAVKKLEQQRKHHREIARQYNALEKAKREDGDREAIHRHQKRLQRTRERQREKKLELEAASGQQARNSRPTRPRAAKTKSTRQTRLAEEEDRDEDDDDVCTPRTCYSRVRRTTADHEEDGAHGGQQGIPEAEGDAQAGVPTDPHDPIIADADRQDEAAVQAPPRQHSVELKPDAKPVKKEIPVIDLMAGDNDVRERRLAEERI